MHLHAVWSEAVALFLVSIRDRGAHIRIRSNDVLEMGKGETSELPPHTHCDAPLVSVFFPPTTLNRLSSIVPSIMPHNLCFVHSIHPKNQEWVLNALHFLAFVFQFNDKKAPFSSASLRLLSPSPTSNSASILPLFDRGALPSLRIDYIHEQSDQEGKYASANYHHHKHHKKVGFRLTGNAYSRYSSQHRIGAVDGLVTGFLQTSRTSASAQGQQHFATKRSR